MRLRRVRKRNSRGDDGSPRGGRRGARRRRPCRRSAYCDGRRQDDLGAWDWEGPAHDAANAAADDARHEALRNDWVEHAATKAKDDAVYKEAVTERSNLYDALGWDDVSAARAAASEALERDMYRQNDAIIEGKRRARVRLRWAGAKAATRAIGRHRWRPPTNSTSAESARSSPPPRRRRGGGAHDVSSSRPPAPTEDEADAAPPTATTTATTPEKPNSLKHSPTAGDVDESSRPNRRSFASADDGGE